MQSGPSPTTPLFFGLISEPAEWRTKKDTFLINVSRRWWKKNSLKSSTSNRTGVWGYSRPEATDYLHFIDREQRGASEKQRRCSQVLGSMPCFWVVTFSLPPWLLCDTIPSDQQRWQIHVPVSQNPYFSLSMISQTCFYCEDLTGILPQDQTRVADCLLPAHR